jgi:hypothetical protein
MQHQRNIRSEIVGLRYQERALCSCGWESPTPRHTTADVHQDWKEHARDADAQSRPVGFQAALDEARNLDLDTIPALAATNAVEIHFADRVRDLLLDWIETRAKETP